MFEHKEADRVPITDDPWSGTLARWKKEGMPAGIDWRDFFGVDKVETINVDKSPRYERKIIEETADYIIATTEWGVTLKNFKVPDSTPEFLDYKINSPERWEEAKERMTVSRDRIDWDFLKSNIPQWQAEGRWIQAEFWFGFDVLHSWMAGFETVLIAMLEEPEWFSDMVNTCLDRTISHFDMIWDEGFHFDSIRWPDDMGYKNRSFFSNVRYQYYYRFADYSHFGGSRNGF
jgi:uroporphyrinogen decarboxylase